jgi:signal transduction histidine kinase/ligand-binding sensor domain-containing protein
MSTGVSKIRILAVGRPLTRSIVARSYWPNKAAALVASLSSILLLASTVYALDPNLRITQYIHKSWRTQDGSAPAGVLSIAQTSDGFLWFSAIPKGLYRFDGVRFLPQFMNTQIGSMAIGNVVADQAGGFWAIGDHEIAHLKHGRVTAHIELEGIGGRAGISRDPDGSLWVTRASNRVADAPLCHITDQAVKCFGKSDGMPISPADELLPDGKGGFWVGGQMSLVHWRAGVSEVYPIAALKSNAGDVGINRLVFGADGSLWVGIAAAGPGLGLGQLRDGVFRPFVTSNFDGSKVAVYDMILDRDGNLWVATLGKGVFRIRGNVVEHYGHTEGLSSDTAAVLFEDREGIVWAGTTNGVDSFRDPRIVTFSALEGLGKDAAAGVLVSRDGTIWVANSASLDHIVNGTVSSIRTANGLPGHQVASMLQDRSGNMWVGVDDGLYLLKAGRFRRIPEPNHQPLGLVVGITEDIDGNVWAECAGNPRKLVRIRDFRVVEELTPPQVPPGHTLAPDANGGIWIGTLGGDLVRLHDGTLQKFSLHAKGSPVSHQIIAEVDGKVLVASDDGLVGLRQDTVQRMTKKNGLPCDSVISFIRDNAKQWWLYTECGVVELPDAEIQRWWVDPDTVVQARVYDVLDGALPNQPSFNSAALSPDGRVWFATGFVVQMIDPSRLSQKALPAETYIQSVIVDRNEFQASDNLKLSPHPRDLQIDYTSPTSTIPQKVKFRYRLDGYDRDWHDAGTRRQAFYTDLPPGKYSFRVTASNSDGVWDDTPAKLDFSVSPAYYQTIWFRALCAALLLGLAWAVHRLRIRQLQHQFDMTLDARVGERTRIARDLHDTLLQSAHGLLLRFQIISQLLPDRPIEAKETLDRAIAQTADFITEARDEVQGLRDSTVQTNDLALAISTLGEELTTGSTNHRPAFRVALEGEARNLHPILRDEVYKIAAEALRNAFRHSRAKRVEVEIRYDNEQFRLRIRDDGKGIDPAVLEAKATEGHYGLPGMRERATIIGGKLVVWSEVDAGTEVELRVPASAAYERAARSSWFSRKAKT